MEILGLEFDGFLIERNGFYAFAGLMEFGKKRNFV